MMSNTSNRKLVDDTQPAMGEMSGRYGTANAHTVAKSTFFSFGPFRLLPLEGALLDGEILVRLGSRAMAILLALVENAGELVTKRELIDRVWPDTTVSDANLTVHIVSLRRVLGQREAGERYIINEPGRGYRFAAPVQKHDASPGYAPPISSRRSDNLPAQLTRLVGRDNVMQALAQRLATKRLVTIIGAGGMGKTAVALNLAATQVARFANGVWVVDFALISDPELVPTVFASALRLEVNSNEPMPDLLAALQEKEMLLVLDNCEHVIDAAAGFASMILKGAKGINILATSREPLRVEGEQTWRLPPLSFPISDERLTAAEALCYPAVQLFTERAAAAVSDFVLRDADAESVCLICRELDGVPLSIEFAAARVDMYGARGVASGLDNRLSLLTGGRRDAAPRHRTMSATLDWSYDLLEEPDKRVFRYLTIFAGGFSLDSAAALMPDLSQVANRLADLVTKSLVSADVTDSGIRFRLLQTTRTYGLAKLIQHNEMADLQRRHAVYFRDKLLAAWLAERDGSQPSSAARFASDIDNIRAALTWSLAPDGDLMIAADLGAASATVWLSLSLLAECHSWMSKVFAALGPEELTSKSGRSVGAALSSLGIFARGAAIATPEAWSQSLIAPDDQADLLHRIDSLLARWTHTVRAGNYPEARLLCTKHLELAERFGEQRRINTNWFMRGTTGVYSGEWAEGRTYLSEFINRETQEERRAFISVTAFDRRSASLGYLAMTDWIEGRADQALLRADEAMNEARTCGGLAICEALAFRGYLHHYLGNDLMAAERDAEEMIARGQRHGLKAHSFMGGGLSGLCRSARGDTAGAEPLLRAAIGGLMEMQHQVFTPVLIGEAATIMAADSRIEEGLAFVRQSGGAGNNIHCWCGPELYRRIGELMVARGDIAQAHGAFAAAGEAARIQGALAWELRIALSWSDLLRREGRDEEALSRLAAVRGQLIREETTADIRRADEALLTRS